MVTKSSLFGIKNIFQERLLINLRNSNFRFLWGSSLLGHLSLAMGLIVLGWIVLDMTQDPWMVSQTIFSYGIFLFTLNIFSGTITDRFPRKSLMIIGSLIRLGSWIFLATMASTNGLNIWHIIVGSAIVGLGVGIEMPSSRVLFHDLVGNKSLMNAMSLDSISRHASRGVGPLIGGVLYEMAGPEVALMAICIVQVASLLSLIPIKIPVELLKNIGGGSFIKDLLGGFAYLSKNQMVLAFVLGSCITNLFLLPMIFILPVFAREILSITPSELGILTLVGTLGSIAGATLMATNPRISKPGLLWIGIAYFLAAVTLAFSWSAIPILSMFLLVLHGLAFATFGALQPSIVILASTEKMRGRTSGFMSLSMCLAQVGAFVMGAFIERLGASMGLAASTAIAVVLLSLLVLILPTFIKGSMTGQVAGTQTKPLATLSKIS